MVTVPAAVTRGGERARAPCARASVTGQRVKSQPVEELKALVTSSGSLHDATEKLEPTVLPLIEQLHVADEPEPV
jgi:hypothetical protein